MLWLLVLAVALSGCTTAQQSSSNGPGFASADGTAVAAVADPVPAGASGDYKIGALDVLDVSVFQVPDLTKTVQVSSSGTVMLPLIGQVMAAGKTVDQLQADITAKLGAKYLQNPQVSVFVKDAQSQRITVNGAVGKPGIYPTTGDTTLIQGIALAGGLTDIADPNAVVVFRQVNGKRQVAKFDFKAIQSGNANDPKLHGGDIVVVDQSGLKATLRGITSAVPVFGLFAPLL